MPPPASLPSLSELQAWPTEHFDMIADWCDAEADRWEGTFTEARQQLRDADWAGPAHDTAVHRLETDLGKARGGGTALRDASKILRMGGENERFAKTAALRLVAEAQSAGYFVDEDLSVTDTMTYTSWDQATARRAAGREFAADIRTEAGSLVRIDQDMAARLPAVSAELRNVRFDERKGHNGVQLVNWGNAPLAPRLDGPPRDDVIAEATDLEGNHVVLRRGYWDALSPNDGWGWDKVSGKHGITNANVFNDVISHSIPKERSGNTLVYEVPIERTEAIRHHFGPFAWTEYRRTGDIVTLRIVANVGEPRPDVYGGGQKGVITMYPLPEGSGVTQVAPNWTKVPGWVNTHFPVPDGA